MFAASKSESLVTKSLVLKLSDERLDDWVRVLNMGSRKLQADAPLSAQDVRRIIHLGLVDVGSMYLELERALSTATARLQIVGRESATLNDFKTLPGCNEAGYELLNHILTICRKEKVLSVAAWVSHDEAHVSDMLASYTFVPRHIRTRMKLQLTTPPADIRLDSPCVVEGHEGLRPEGILRWGLGPRADGVGLTELRNILDSRWRSSVSLRWKGQDEPLVVGCVSDPGRRHGWILVKENLSPHDIQSWPLVEMLNRVLLVMYGQGVRDVMCEVDASLTFQSPFMEIGFRSETMYFEFLLSLMHDSSS